MKTKFSDKIEHIDYQIETAEKVLIELNECKELLTSRALVTCSLSLYMLIENLQGQIALYHREAMKDRTAESAADCSTDLVTESRSSTLDNNDSI